MLYYRDAHLRVMCNGCHRTLEESEDVVVAPGSPSQFSDPGNGVGHPPRTGTAPGQPEHYCMDCPLPDTLAVPAPPLKVGEVIPVPV
jgi:hypothetical protein